jgi:hypothetical protein
MKETMPVLTTAEEHIGLDGKRNRRIYSSAYGRWECSRMKNLGGLRTSLFAIQLYCQACEGTDKERSTGRKQNEQGYFTILDVTAFTV